MSRHTLIVSASFVATTLTSSVAMADYVTFDMIWEGINGSNASATGSLTIDTSILDIAAGASAVSSFGVSGSPFVDFMITIEDAQTNNGTYSVADGHISLGIWDATGPLDLGTELIGQAGFEGFNFWPTSTSLPGNAPAGILNTHRDSPANDQLVMTSMISQNVSVVPLPPAAWAGLGLLGVMGVRRRLSR
ncbi:MAG: hypothetical protein ACF8MF_10560 [Phycisphaerales bacterium JB052]